LDRALSKKKPGTIGTDRTDQALRIALGELSDKWRRNPAVSWTEMYQTGEQLLEWKHEKNMSGLWTKKPVMITATLEDGVGQGLKMIHLFSRVAGIDIVPLGLMQKETAIIKACLKKVPDFLGMTILQFDSEERLSHMADKIPKATRIIVGGPIFNMMDRGELSDKPYIVLNTVSDYIGFLLRWDVGVC
jgi:methylmalonyl-CoA mutase cobalamin-binding subunit